MVDSILEFLGVRRKPPSARYLDQLVSAYVRKVPWETAFRIVKRASTPATRACPRWPDEFWHDARLRGGGGTCYESNYAFFFLLQALGFEGYLTVNDMNTLQGCHSAIVVQLDGDRWLVDVGYPLYLPLPLEVGQTMQRETPFHTYTLTPQGGDIYEVTRSRHPKPYVFTLQDRPVSDTTYRAITTRDYDHQGQFLSELIIHRIIDERIWRYNGRNDPPVLASFGATNAAIDFATGSNEQTEQVMAGDVAPILSDLFGIDLVVLRTAFHAVNK